MSLRDTACYTLDFCPSPKDANVVELVDTTSGRTGEARFARVREKREGEVYSSVLYDALSAAKLASTGFANDKIKSRRLELHNPDEGVPFEFTGKLGFEWTFTFENNKYRWKKEGVSGSNMVCVLDRRPDPQVEVALARGADKTSPAKLSILHYNIERFEEIRDWRGLEALFAMSLCCLLDSADERAAERVQKYNNGARPAVPPKTGSGSSGSRIPAGSGLLVNPEDFVVEDLNEVIVGVHTDIDVHVARALGLLEDKNVLFIVIRTKQAEAAQRALQVSLAVTRFRHREGLPDLHQYVIEEKAEEPKGPKVIRLDDPPRAPGWTPPPNLAIYLSTIELPDLKPQRRESAPGLRPRPPPPQRPSSAGTNGHGGSLSPPVGHGRRPSSVNNVPMESPPVPPTAGRPPEGGNRLSKLLRPSWK